VLFEAVLGIHHRQCSIDASGGDHGVRVITPPLAHAHHLHRARLARRPAAPEPITLRWETTDHPPEAVDIRPAQSLEQ
jgi:hypothetical protein